MVVGCGGALQRDEAATTAYHTSVDVKEKQRPVVPIRILTDSRCKNKECLTLDEWEDYFREDIPTARRTPLSKSATTVTMTMRTAEPTAMIRTAPACTTAARKNKLPECSNSLNLFPQAPLIEHVAST